MLSIGLLTGSALIPHQTVIPSVRQPAAQGEPEYPWVNWSTEPDPSLEKEERKSVTTRASRADTRKEILPPAPLVVATLPPVVQPQVSLVPEASPATESASNTDKPLIETTDQEPVSPQEPTEESPPETTEEPEVEEDEEEQEEEQEEVTCSRKSRKCKSRSEQSTDLDCR